MPKTSNKPKMAPISRILEKKVGGENEILYPTPTPFDWDGKTYKIRPLTNRALKGLAGEFERVTDLIARIAAIHAASREEGEPERAITPAEFLPYMPEVLEILLPNATRIIADSLRVDEQAVEDEMFLGKQIECLRLIVEANDFPLLFANFESLTGMFTPPKATDSEMNADEEADAETAETTEDD